MVALSCRGWQSGRLLRAPVPCQHCRPCHSPRSRRGVTIMAQQPQAGYFTACYCRTRLVLSQFWWQDAPIFISTVTATAEHRLDACMRQRRQSIWLPSFDSSSGPRLHPALIAPMRHVAGGVGRRHSRRRPRGLGHRGGSAPGVAKRQSEGTCIGASCCPASRQKSLSSLAPSAAVSMTAGDSLNTVAAARYFLSCFSFQHQLR